MNPAIERVKTLINTATIIQHFRHNLSYGDLASATSFRAKPKNDECLKSDCFASHVKQPNFYGDDNNYRLQIQTKKSQPRRINHDSENFMATLKIFFSRLGTAGLNIFWLLYLTYE